MSCKASFSSPLRQKILRQAPFEFLISAKTGAAAQEEGRRLRGMQDKEIFFLPALI
jgi:hypothetical protein